MVTSRFRYVVLSHNRTNPFRVLVRRQGRLKHVGYYASVEEAIAARDSYCKRHGIKPKKSA